MLPTNPRWRTAAILNCHISATVLPILMKFGTMACLVLKIQDAAAALLKIARIAISQQWFD